MDRSEAYRKVVDRLAMNGTYLNVGEKVTTLSGTRARSSLST
jgi:hypothetical protein